MDVNNAGNVAERPLQLVDVPGERLIRSVANNTRLDGREFLAEAARLPVRTHVQTFAFDQVNDALIALKNDAIRGAGVINSNGVR